MKFSLLCPTRDRPKRLRAMVDSALDLAADAGNVEIQAGVDFDDPQLAAYLAPEAYRNTGFTLYEERVRPSVMWQRLANVATGRFLMLCNDDVLFRTPKWDELVEAEFAKVPDELLFAYTNDLEPPKRERANHWFVSRRWVDVLGFFCWEGDCAGLGPLEYFGNDNIPWYIAQRAGRCVYLRHVHVEHMHFKYGKAAKDDTYTLPRLNNPTSRDEPRLEAMGPQLDAWAAKINGAKGA